MSELASAVCSITITQRRKYFWAAWWTGAPREVPFRTPDGSNGGLATMDAALTEAELRAGRYLVLVEPYWARAWTRVLRGERPPPRRDPRVERPARTAPVSAWELLGLPAGAALSDVKAAFRQRALLAHPDQGGDAEDFRELHGAYERLVDRLTRAR